MHENSHSLGPDGRSLGPPANPEEVRTLLKSQFSEEAREKKVAYLVSTQYVN